MRYILTCTVFLLFFGCAPKIDYTKSQSYFVVVKNPQIAIADTGFIKKNSNTLNLQVFSAGTVVLELLVSDDVCINSLCLSPREFNKRFFGFEHYKGFMKNLLNFQPIYNRKNLQQLANGFTQNLKTNNYNISYRVKNRTLYFKDKNNKILIKLRKL
jgi:hypothetical protein